MTCGIYYCRRRYAPTAETRTSIYSVYHSKSVPRFPRTYVIACARTTENKTKNSEINNRNETKKKSGSLFIQYARVNGFVLMTVNGIMSSKRFEFYSCADLIVLARARIYAFIAIKPYD